MLELDRKVLESITIDACSEDFGAIRKAEALLKGMDWSVGRMEHALKGSNPIAISKESGIYVSKWTRLGEDISRISGKIVALPVKGDVPNFRRGGCRVEFYERPV